MEFVPRRNRSWIDVHKQLCHYLESGHRTPRLIARSTDHLDALTRIAEYRPHTTVRVYVHGAPYEQGRQIREAAADLIRGENVHAASALLPDPVGISCRLTA